MRLDLAVLTAVATLAAACATGLPAAAEAPVATVTSAPAVAQAPTPVLNPATSPDLQPLPETSTEPVQVEASALVQDPAAPPHAAPSHAAPEASVGVQAPPKTLGGDSCPPCGRG